VVQRLYVLNSVTNGYHDIQTDWHRSAFVRELVIYRYNGHEYKATDCFEKVLMQRPS
jgi:hypothetical protein